METRTKIKAVWAFAITSIIVVSCVAYRIIEAFSMGGIVIVSAFTFLLILMLAITERYFEEEAYDKGFADGRKRAKQEVRKKAKR